MCCLSEASSHFVVFVCVNPDRKPSRKMNRLNKEAVVRALFPFGQQHVDKLRDRKEATLRLLTCDLRINSRINALW